MARAERRWAPITAPDTEPKATNNITNGTATGAVELVEGDSTIAR